MKTVQDMIRMTDNDIERHTWEVIDSKIDEGRYDLVVHHAAMSFTADDLLIVLRSIGQKIAADDGMTLVSTNWVRKQGLHIENGVGVTAEQSVKPPYVGSTAAELAAYGKTPPKEPADLVIPTHCAGCGERLLSLCPVCDVDDAVNAVRTVLEGRLKGAK